LAPRFPCTAGGRRHKLTFSRALNARGLAGSGLAFILCAALFALGVAPAAGVPARRARQASGAQQCADPYPATRDPSNPLDLPGDPGPNPLNGASFFVDGPAHGAAASTIAADLGINPRSLPDSESWAEFESELQSGQLRHAALVKPGMAQAVLELSKIAAEPEVQRISAYSAGGSPAGIFRQTEKLLCHNLAADPGSIPILSTYFLHPAAGACPRPSALAAAGPLFKARVDAMAAAVDRRPAVFLLEIDAIGSSGCIRKVGSLPLWESYLRYEIDAVSALPHTVVYLEGGYSDANSASYTARVLNAAGVQRIRGFFTNDTHANWTIDEVHWATEVSRLTGGAHFIVNTAQNGRGPLRNPHPTTQGNEDLCNPPGRGLGPRPTTDTGFALADAWLWTSPPGNSSGCGGGPPGGVFWPARAIGLAERANGRLGPGYPSEPY
jgi:endoglucanase